MKLLHLGAISIVAFGLSISHEAIARAADPICYMTTNSGQIIDLSRSVCKLDASKPGSNAANSDQAFITAYKQTVMNYPDVRDKLLASIQVSPESRISQAKNICSDLEAGLSVDDIQMTQSEGVASKADAFNVSLVTTLATKYYCPQFGSP